MRNASIGQQRANKASDLDSFWDVTPRTSTSTYENGQVESGQASVADLAKSYESLPDEEFIAATARGPGKLMPRQSPSGKRAIQIEPAFPNANKIPASSLKNDISDSDDDDTFYDDESFDTLDTLSEKQMPAVPPKPSKAQLVEQRNKYTQEEKRKIQNAVSNQSLHSWLDEQADIIEKDGPPQPPPVVKQPNSELTDECSTMSEISSVSKSRQNPGTASPRHLIQNSVAVGKKDVPPPLPPKPSARLLSQQHQQRQQPQEQQQQQQQAHLQRLRQQQGQQASLPQTIIRVVPKNANDRSSPTSETTSCSQSTQQYGTGYYDSLNSRPTTEESESVVTDSTVLGSNANRKMRLAQQPNYVMRSFKGPEQPVTASSANEESSDNTNWERVPMNQSSNLYWEHTGSTQGIYEAKRETRGRTQRRKPQLTQRQTSNYADSSDSLSWKSSVDEEVDDDDDEEDDDDETTVVSQQVVPNSQPGRIARLRQNLESDVHFSRSVGDIQKHLTQQRLERQLSEDQSLATASAKRDNDRPQFTNNAKLRSGSVEILDMQCNPDLEYCMKRAQSERGLESDADLLDHRKVTIGKETVIPDNGQSSRSADERLVRYSTDGKQPLKLIGGNATGVFVHEIDKKSKAAEQDLRVGDRILKLNNRSTRNMTREDVYAVLKNIKSWVKMTVRYEVDAYRKVLEEGGSGDSFFVKTHFAYDASSKSEFSFRNGDVFAVRDTMPNGKHGLWRVARVRDDPGREETGFIPNKFRADQIATSYKIAQLRAEEIRSKGGVIRKSFKRAKSLDRGMNKADGDDFREALRDVKSYEWVTRKTPDLPKPVVLLGLFCDSVRDLLVRDLPERFAPPKGAVELSTNAPGDDPSVPPVNTRPIEAVMRQGRHCLLILSPSNIRYLREKTSLNPIVIYLCPANKAIVKSLKARFAPGFERKPGFMFDEAIQFSKRHQDLFSTTVTYTNDGEWSKRLKETISRLQDAPIWIPLIQNATGEESSDDEEDSGEADAVSFPIQRQPFKQALIRPDQSGERGRSRRAANNARVSKTTDDLPDVPDEIRDVLYRHMGVSSAQHSRSGNHAVDDVLSDLPQDEASTVSNQSQLDTSHSSNSGSGGGSGKPKRSILKNRSQSSFEDGSGRDAESSTTTSTSGGRTRGRQFTNTRNPPRAITIEHAEPPVNQPLHQQQHAQQMAARHQYVIQKRETPL